MENYRRRIPWRITTAMLPQAVWDKPTLANFSSGMRGPVPLFVLLRCQVGSSRRNARDLRRQGGSRQRELGFTAAWNHPWPSALPSTLLPTASSHSAPALPSLNKLSSSVSGCRQQIRRGKNTGGTRRMRLDGKMPKEKMFCFSTPVGQHFLRGEGSVLPNDVSLSYLDY